MVNVKGKRSGIEDETEKTLTRSMIKFSLTITIDVNVWLSASMYDKAR